MILCDRPKCEAIADYLEVEADGTEPFHCRFHTTSETYACRLLARAPDRNGRYRSIQLVTGRLAGRFAATASASGELGAAEANLV